MKKKYSVFQYFLLSVLSLLLYACENTEKSEYNKNENVAYLFTYFTGNGEGEEAVRYALSEDGYNYYALNNNEPIISSEEISNTGGVRDPHILRGANRSFRMVVTDLLTQNGWSNTEMVLLKSDNLIDWTSTVINIPDTFEEFSDVSRVWAPQTFYDEEKEKYMVYFSMLQPDSYDKIYYAYANEDFTELETTPKQLFYNPKEMASIDGDIIKKDGKFHLFYKTEGDEDKGIKVAISDSLTGGYEPMEGNVDQTDQAVEGSGVFKLIDSDKYILMYDVYMDGRYEFAESNDLKNFELVSEDISMNFHPRHGTVLPITEEEVNQLLEAFPSDDFPVITGSNSSAVKQKNIIIDEAEKSIYLPVKNGTDLSSFNPELGTFPSIEITNPEAKNFENGVQEYTVKLANGEEKIYKVQVEIANNPVVEGYYADPEIIYSEREEKYYLYPTSDGFHGWSGTYFETFSSEDLINWKNEGTILDLKKDVDWADRNAWAPCAIEKEIDGEYKYFYYFTAAQKIGVAVADQPEGPFEDIGEPLISEKPEGVKGGQVIDPDVFTDPESGKSYLYWGNGFMAVAELNEDMTSLKEGTEKVITPDNTFREGAEVFFRDGKYYFLWSENDTRSPDYRVRYATSTSPTGPLEIPEENMVIEKDEENEIYGTGHNSVIQVPGKDEWYIVYHRFTRPKGIDMGREAGFHREVAIDKLEFDEDGTIKKVKPTVKGIESLKTSE
ncbi:beta-xylosidase [Salegentibacter salinarum]|uniref:Beta-xylosidase n=1 Tax=Salegentibacter salinarum TaxID=447422 RepID=A0A2N0TSJ0_9FLAO|nr:family 43 glycosylhydrolase [Salegentibacter salinarum]PKD17703.1 beta-xylosidase [Salegentibacter salinarum]SKB51197.1 Beta-xylosidase [Salegentibacter salinarum]